MNISEIVSRVRTCDECPFKVEYTDWEDVPQRVRYCAINLEKGRFGWYHHEPNTREKADKKGGL